MKAKIKHFCVLATITTLTGCLLPYDQFTAKVKGYSGPELSPEEVATVRLTQPLLFVGTDEITPSKPILATTITLLPGRRIIRVGCLSEKRLEELYDSPNRLKRVSVPLSILTTDLRAYRVIDLNVEAGRTYEIESHFRRSGDGDYYKWITPVFDNRYPEQIEATIYDGMLKLGTEENPRRPYKRE